MRAYGRAVEVLVIGLILAAQQAPEARAAAEAGRIVVANGDVQINSKAAHPNDAVFKSDTVKTGANATAKVMFTDQSILDLGPSSALNVAQYQLGDGENRTGVFSLLYGSLRALITRKVGAEGNVSVKTSNAVMGVRGTEFVVEKPQGQPASEPTTVTVVSGTVRVVPPGGGPAVMVGAGQQMRASPKTFALAASQSRSVASAGGGGVVSKVSQSDLAAKLNDTKAPDNTFAASVNLAAGGGNNSQAIANIASVVTAAVTETQTQPLPPPPPAPPPVPPAPLPPPAQLTPGPVLVTVGVH